MPTDATHLKVNNIQLEIIDRGLGRPLLFLHPGIGIDPKAPVLDRLATRARLIAPSHPGFGNSEQPRSSTTLDDLAYFYLDLLEHFDLKHVTIVGVSLGGWIAAEMAVKSTQRISRLVLANTVGINSEIRVRILSARRCSRACLTGAIFSKNPRIFLKEAEQSFRLIMLCGASLRIDVLVAN